MLNVSQLRQIVLFLLAGGALVVSGMALSQRHEAVAVPPPIPRADELSAAFRQVAAEASPSVVSIESIAEAKQVRGSSNGSPLNDDQLRRFFGSDPRLEEFFKNRGQQNSVVPQRRSAGSGFIISTNGTIMTNRHVVNGADRVKVRLHDGREFIARDIKSDDKTDVAIIRIDATDLKSIRLGDSKATEVGDWVLAIGSPFGLDMTVTAGIISAKHRSNRITDRADFLQTDAAINPGNSGGPLINMRGEVIGINTAIATESGGYDGIGFAIPADIAGWVSDQLMTVGEVRRGYLGIKYQPVDADSAKRLKVKLLEGVMVREVMPKSPAAKAGLEPQDVILSFNGQKIDSLPALQGVVEQLTIGRSYPVDVIRNGKQQTLHVTVEAFPADRATARSNDEKDDSSGAKFDNLGLELRNLTKDLAKQLELDATKGVVVTGVRPGSIAHLSNIKPGDVIEKAGGQPVNTVEDYERAKAEFASGDGLVLNLRAADGAQSFVVLKSNPSN